MSRIIMFSILAGAIGGYLVMLLVAGLLAGSFSVENSRNEPVGFNSFSLFRMLVGGVFGYLTYGIFRRKKEVAVIIGAFLAGLFGTGVVTFCAVAGLAQ